MQSALIGLRWLRAAGSMGWLQFNRWLAGDPPLQVSPFLVIELPVLQGPAAEIGFRRPAQSCHQSLAPLGKGRQVWRWPTKQLPPKLPGGIDQQAAVLQQHPAAPKLGAADPFGAVAMDQIGGAGPGKAAPALPHHPFSAEAQGLAELGEGPLQPAAMVAVGLAPIPGGMGLDQGVGEAAAMEHGPAAAGAPHQLHQPLLGQGQPGAG